MRTFLFINRIYALLLILAFGAAATAPGYGQAGPTGTQQPEILTLDTALNIALRTNRQIHIADSRIEQARQGVGAARASLLPQINLQATGGQLLDSVTAHFPKGILGAVNGTPIPAQDLNISSGNRFAALYIFTVAQPVTQIPRILTGVRLQQIGVDLAGEQARQQRQTIAANVRQVYYTLQQTQAGIAAAGESLRALLELERTVANEVAQQAALRADLLDVQARRDRQEATLLTLGDTLQQYKEQMNVLLARDIHTPFQVTPAPESLPQAGPDTEASLQTQALRDRPDLRRAALQLRQAELDRRSSQLEALPDLSLAMNYYGVGGGITGLPDHLWTLGFQLSWSPIDWGRRRHEVAAKSAVVDQARLAYEEAQAQAQVDVNGRIRAERETRERTRAAQAAQAAARERLRVTLNQYRERAALLKDVLQAQAALADADRQVQEAALGYFTALSDLRKAIGAE